MSAKSVSLSEREAGLRERIWCIFGVSLTPAEAVVLYALLRHEHASHETLLQALYAEDPDGGPLSADDCIKVRVCLLRKKVPGLTITSIHGFGYRARMEWPDESGAGSKLEGAAP